MTDLDPDLHAGLYPRLAATVARLDLTEVPTPCVVIAADLVDQNIAHLVELLGSPARARPHIKTARLGWTLDRLRAAGVSRVKAATVAEAALALRNGVTDVLLAYPAVGPALIGMGALATAYPDRRVSALVDDPGIVSDWPTTALGAFLDLDTGLGRTGVAAGDRSRVLAVKEALHAAGVPLRGLHAYDGHLAGSHDPHQEERVRTALRPVIALAQELDPPELVVGGSHTFLPAVRLCDEEGLGAVVAGSPGTVVYGDHRSVTRFAGSNRFTPAVSVLSRVVSAPAPDSITVDAGLTAIQVDAGRPHFVVAGRPAWIAGEAAQEHAALHGPELPPVGTVLPLVPFHVDTALAQFASVLVLVDGELMRQPLEVRHGVR